MNQLFKDLFVEANGDVFKILEGGQEQEFFIWM
jgi:hypothetical protein